MSSPNAIVPYDRSLTMAVDNLKNIRNLLYSHEDDMAAFLPRWTSLTTSRIISTAIIAVDQSPAKDKLLRCSGKSVLQSVRDAIEFGLSFAKALGQAYLVPFKGQCTLMIGYRGLADLVRRAADVKVLDSGVVYEGEVFEAIKGDKPSLRHVQRFDIGRSDGNIVAAYAIAFYENEHPQFEVLGLEAIKKIRATSKMSDRGPWKEWFGELSRKSAIRRLCKLLPVSAERMSLMARVFEHEHAGLADIPQVSPQDRLAELKNKVGGEVEVKAEVVDPKEDLFEGEGADDDN